MALRDPDKTKRRIVETAAKLFHQKGYKGTSLTDILDAAAISKGALYHHFSTKQDVLYAAFDDIFAELFLSRWLTILDSDQPIEAIANVVSSLADGAEEQMCDGCPVHNLAAELAGQDEQIRLRVDQLYSQIQSIIRQGIETAKHSGQVADEVNPHQVSLFFMCCLNGIPQMVKSCQDIQVFNDIVEALVDYIHSLTKQSQ
jgi:AcrR family transcriptional regulator